MKVYISTDLEGVSGVTMWEQTREPTAAAYQHARHLLTCDVNAAVEGCLAGGADEVVVLDGHGLPLNFIPDELHPGAAYVVGPGRGAHTVVDGSFDAAMLVGYHAMAGTPDAVLAHTQSSKAGCRYWYNGRESGEIAQCAAAIGHHGIPVVMVTGDAAACAEAHEFLGDGIVTVSVKKGTGITSCVMVPPKRAWDMIREGAAEALTRIGQCEPYKLDVPITARLQYGSKEIADKANCSRSTRIDDRTFERTMDSQLEVLRF